MLHRLIKPFTKYWLTNRLTKELLSIFIFLTPHKFMNVILIVWSSTFFFIMNVFLFSFVQTLSETWQTQMQHNKPRMMISVFRSVWSVYSVYWLHRAVSCRADCTSLCIKTYLKLQSDFLCCFLELFFIVTSAITLCTSQKYNVYFLVSVLTSIKYSVYFYFIFWHKKLIS